MLQALSVDPLNIHALELLNLALQTVTDSSPFGGSVPGGEGMWEKIMKEQAELIEIKRGIPAEKDKKGPFKIAAQLNIEQGEDVAMTDI